jgi:hypothetical protein
MPKELTHLIIAESAKKRFLYNHPNTRLGQTLASHADHFRFGAVMHDVSFCGSSSNRGKALKDRGMAVHGNPANDTIRPFRNLAAVWDKTGNPEILALIAGSASHMIADCAFHPFVYHYTGEDIARHYRLETLIDTHLYPIQNHWLEVPVSTGFIYRHFKHSLESLAGHLLVFLDLDTSFKPEIIKALKLHAFTIKLFRSRAGYHLFRFISLFGGEGMRCKAMLFYPSGMRFKAPFFESDFMYRHPLTGEKTSGSIAQFVDTAVQKASDLFENIDQAISARSLEQFFSGISSVSLETALPPSMGRSFRFTDLSLTVDRLVSGL